IKPPHTITTPYTYTTLFRSKIHPHTFGANQPNNLLYLVNQRLGCIIEKQMRFVKKEDELRLIQVPDLRQVLIEFCEQPQQESSVKTRRLHEAVCSQYIDHSASV